MERITMASQKGIMAMVRQRGTDYNDLWQAKNELL